MAMRNALMPFQLPEAASISALTNPLMQGMQTYRQGMAQQFEGDRALQQERMQQRKLNLDIDEREYRRRRQIVEDVGKAAVAADSEQDPARRASLHQAILARHPDAATLPAHYRDPMLGPRLLRAEAGKARDELDEQYKRAQIQLMRSKTNAVYRASNQDAKQRWVIDTSRGVMIDRNSGEIRPISANAQVKTDPLDGLGMDEDGNIIAGSKSAPDAPYSQGNGDTWQLTTPLAQPPAGQAWYEDGQFRSSSGATPPPSAGLQPIPRSVPAVPPPAQPPAGATGLPVPFIPARPPAPAQQPQPPAVTQQQQTSADAPVVIEVAPGKFRAVRSGRMNLGGPIDDIDASMRLDEGRPAARGIQVAQAGPQQPAPWMPSPSQMDQARARMFGPIGTTSPEVPGVVTDAGRNRRVDQAATRELQGQRAIQEAKPEDQERLRRFREDQERWSWVYKRQPRAGYYYGPDGREQPLTDKNFKGDREAQAVALLNLKKIEAASKTLLDAPLGLPQRAVQGQFNMGDIGQAFVDMKQAAMGIAYALSGKTVAVAEMKNFMDAYGPGPTDTADRIRTKTQRLREFYNALITASRGGETYEQAFAKASATMGIKNPDGSPMGAPAAASGGQAPPPDLTKIPTDELLRRLQGAR